MNAPAPRVNIGDLVIGDELGRGGQGRVAAVSGPLIGGQPAAVKLYSPAVRSTFDARVLESIVRFQHELPPRHGRWLQATAAWPATLVLDQGAVCGFLMRSVPPPYYFSYHSQTYGAQRKLAEVAFLLNSDDYARRAGIPASDHDRIGLLADLAATLSRLHGHGVVIGDFSPKNILFRLRPAPSCFFIDCDAVRLHGATVVRQVETTDWETPPGEPLATIATDSLKFGLLAIRLFARDQSSRDASALAAVSAELGRLARLSQHPDPAQRPGPGAWTSALTAAARSPSPAGQPRPAPGPDSAPGRRTSVPRARQSPRPPRKAQTAPPRPWPAYLYVGLIIAMAITAAVLMYSSLAGASAADGTADAATASGKVQAGRVDTVLDQSATARRLVQNAVNDINVCSDVARAVAKLERVVAQRSSQLRQASALQTAALPRGLMLKTDLTNALRASLRADREFLRWAREIESRGCTYPAQKTNAYKDGLEASASANTQKAKFIRIWDPIARNDELRARSPVGI